MPRFFGRRSLVALGASLVLLTIVDLRRPPADQWATRGAVGLIHAYQATLSPLYDRMGVQCRFTPTCSHYGETSIRQFGLVRGGWLAARRVVRCGPWTPAGTVDPPPTPGESHRRARSAPNHML
jgi:putative membrane protein insertion efficiency factor